MTVAGLSVQYQRTDTEDLPGYSWADIGRAAEFFGFDPAKRLILDRLKSLHCLTNVRYYGPDVSRSTRTGCKPVSSG